MADFFWGVPLAVLPMVGQPGSGYPLLCGLWRHPQGDAPTARIPLLSLTLERLGAV